MLSNEAEPGLLVSVAVRVHALLEATENGLAAQYAHAFDSAARGRFETLQVSGLGNVPVKQRIGAGVFVEEDEDFVG